jgi:circadian clock protein KaiB
MGGPRLALRLYIDDETLYSRRAVVELEALRDSVLQPDTEVEVIDIRAAPEVAERERLLAMPTLIRLSPAPEQRIVGDLSDRATVLSFLHLAATEAP